MGNSKLDKYRRAQQTALDDMKREAKKAGRVSLAELVPWTPFERAESLPELPNDDIFINSRYQVNIRKGVAPPPFGKFLELSIKTRDKAAYRDWRDFQRIKNELVGEEFEGLELYPDERRLVDTANQFYMFVFRPQFTNHWFPFGYTSRLVVNATFGGAVQRPFEVTPPDVLTGEEFKKFIIKHMEAANAEPAIPNREP